MNFKCKNCYNKQNEIIFEKFSKTKIQVKLNKKKDYKNNLLNKNLRKFFNNYNLHCFKAKIAKKNYI